jgi:hypothetical protein
MRQHWSFRSNKRQHIAQILRFEPPAKEGIIELPAPMAAAIPDLPDAVDGRRQMQNPASGDKSCIQDLA